MRDMRGKTWNVNVHETDVLGEFGTDKVSEVVKIGSDPNLRLDRVRVWIDEGGTIIHIAVG